jgi:hypothetical protein
MRTAVRILLAVLLAAASSSAQENQVLRLFQSIVTQPANGTLPTTEEFFTTVNETTMGALPPSEIARVLPLARQCLQSSRPEVRRDGLVLLIAVSTRPDSAKLLEAYIDDLGALLAGPEGAISLRHGALYVLGSMKPSLPPKAMAYLNAHLEDSRNSNEEELTIAASLVEAAPSDPATIHKTLLVVSSRSDAGLTSGVLRQLGTSRSRVPEALNFIGTSLDSANQHVRAAAVDAASRLDRDVRGQFAAQLSRIASDPSEPHDVRVQASAASKP